MAKLDDVLLKEVSDLTDDDKKVLNENKDKLADEDKDVYKDFIKDEEEKDEGFTFKTQDELDTYLDKYTQKKEETKQVAEDEKKEEKTERFFDKGAKFENPEQFAEAFVKKLGNKKLTPDLRKRIREEMSEAKTEEDEKRRKLNAGFDKEIEGLREKDKDIPSKGSKKREVFDRELAETIVEYPGVQNMTQAYKIWRLKKGTPSTDDQKADARKVGGSGGESGGVKGRKYETTATRSLDDAVDAARIKLEAGE